MTIFDSHAHFPPETVSEHDAQIERARNAGLAGILAVGGNNELDTGATSMASKFPDFVFLSLGYERDAAMEIGTSDGALEKSISDLREQINSLRSQGVFLRAIGEIGLDFSRNPSESDKESQIAFFAAQLELADELELPCTIHSRDADAETLETIERYGSQQMRKKGRLGVIHCFTRDKNFADAAVELGLHIGISGIYTFNNASDLRGTVGTLPLERLLVETDCPYLTPAPMRGKPNEPAMVVHTATRMAHDMQTTPEKIAKITTDNAIKLFALPINRHV
ncbi:MAG: TatD family hydrolase [Lentisphaerae bacterium]|jgi:TatD DNase family protein|nr:TatD family hydrolase [Lentisphaerota bacterium]